ncbi:MAG: hypothetical protein ACREGA_04885 [Candidatus Saccharimonadales bacterium]
MLQLSKTLINRPVLSLRTGKPVATAVAPIFNPNNLKIEGFYCQDGFDKKKHLVLLYQDIRDCIDQGFVINDHDCLSDPADLVRIQDLLELNFQLIGKSVMTLSKDKVGKVNDFATEIETMFVQKIYVSQPLRKTIVNGSLSVDRNQIVEITDRRIIIQDLLQGTPAHAPAPV